MSKLTPEAPRLFRPTLAAWIGLNESIFLEQLNFILTETDKGRFADGKKWYRDTPRAFMITYFPFWDESIVKRTIANLRADALILARSDLNDDPKDRSLWYTINYPRMEKLDGPITRITGKSEKRKEARKARKSKPDNYPDYAKVQNVPLPDEAEIEAEVQSVPDDKSTKCTDENQQNVLLPPVQNVPTPKDSSSIVSNPKKESERESHAHKLKRIGEVDYLNQNETFATKLTEVCGNPHPRYVVNGDRKKLAEATAQLLDWKVTIEQLDDFISPYWWGDSPPRFDQVTKEWGRYLSSKQESRNGVHKPKEIPLNEDSAALAAAFRAKARPRPLKTE